MLDETLITQKKLAQILGTTVCSINTMRSMGKLNDLPHIKWGSQYRYRIQDVEEWIKKHTQTGGFYNGQQ